MCNNKQVAKPCKNCGVGLYWYTDRRDGKSHAYEKFGQPNTWHFLFEILEVCFQQCLFK